MIFVLLALIAAPQATTQALPAPSEFDPQTGFIEPVKAVAAQKDGKVLIGGAFQVNGSTGVARLNADGSLDSRFQATADGGVLAIAVQENGKILVGGGFQHINGQLRPGIARLNKDGSLDTTFNAGLNGSVFTIALQPKGAILIGGHFSRVGQQARGSIARLNDDGTLDTTFAPQQGLVGGWINTVALQADGKVLIGGNFTTFDGYGRSNIARLNTNGTLDQTYNPGANGAVHSSAVQADGWAVVGGNFNLVGGVDRASVARIHADGSLDNAFAQGVNGTVYSVALQADGGVLIAGDFSTFNGRSHNAVARINANGTPDSSFNPDPDDTVNAIVVQLDNKVLLGGEFLQVSGQPRTRIARLNADGTLDDGPILAPNIVDNPLVPDVEAQFANMALHGDPLAINLGIGDDPSVCRHYQSVNRVNGPDGTAYMILLRSGTDTGPWCGGNDDNYPGELLVARMDSRDKDRERLRSNILQRGKDWGDTVPPAEDAGVMHIRFNGGDWGPGLGAFPPYSHPGGSQLIGDVLVVPLEDRCDTRYLAATRSASSTGSISRTASC